jgi:hypothetical protein
MNCGKNVDMHWIYLSPHFDDAVLSCGGLIAQQTRQGDTVEVWTLCAGDLPPGPYTAFVEELHARWETAENTVVLRREEDRLACARLGATLRHFPIPDSVYRRSPQAQGWATGPTTGIGNEITYAALAAGLALEVDPARQPTPDPMAERAVGRALGFVSEAAPLGMASDPALAPLPDPASERAAGRALGMPHAIDVTRVIDPALGQSLGTAASRAANEPDGYIAGFLYPDYHAIFGPIRLEEETLIDNTAELLRGLLPAQARVVCPLTVGGHVDHKLARAIAERIGRPLWYYADYPYAEKKPEQVDLLAPDERLKQAFCLEAGDMGDWCRAILAYQSQLSTFWASEEAMCAAVNAYHDRYNGLRIWHP